MQHSDRPWLRIVDVARGVGVDLSPGAEFRASGHGEVVVGAGDQSTRTLLAEWTQDADMRLLLRDLLRVDTGSDRLMVFPHVTASTARALRDRGIGYLDLSGNAYLRFDGVYVRVEAARRPTAEVRALIDDAARAPSNLFSPGRSQVVFALLQWRHLLGRPVREVAAAAGVSVGLVSGTVGLLEREGYLQRHGGSPWAEGDQLHRVDELVDRWAASFSTGLWRRVHLGDYRSDLDSWTTQPEPAIDVGGELAVRDLVVPASVTIYLDPPLDPSLRARHRIAAAADGRPNTAVCRRFWKVPSPGPPTSGVPWLLTYAELLGHGDPRLRQAGEELRGRAQGGS